VKEIDAILGAQQFREISAEHQRTRKRVRGNPTWYSFNDGPRNIAELAKSLGPGASYALLYREWSERKHSVDAIDRILTHDSSGPAARSLRDPTELNSTIDFAITFAIDAARCLVRYYRPGEEDSFDRWYRREVSPNWKRIPKVEVQNPSEKREGT
jgi:hypothetical protein